MNFFLECSQAKADLVFVLDASGSVTSNNFDLMKDFVKNFLSDADIDGGNVRVGMIVFSTEADVIFILDEYDTKADIYDAIDAISYREGKTNTALALRYLREEMFAVDNGDRLNVDNIAIVITDGYSTINKEKTIFEAEIAHSEGIHIYSIGIGLSDLRELDGIASKPAAANRFAVENFQDLEELQKKVFAVFCCKYPFNYSRKFLFGTFYFVNVIYFFLNANT